ncbi:hypothetical protein NIES4102_01650 [Chondrocystis sp. NIES-4102]|nr:hypothetical protein NIES4102_01650 [Chondrocystis sp. NIES-4102]
MLVYVQSRGIAQENGYCWLNVLENKILPEKPDFVVIANGNAIKLDDLIDTQKYSLVLVRSNQEYYLFITGLKARKERADFMGRQVLNSLLWIYKATASNEEKIRSIVIKALEGTIEGEVDQLINPGGEQEFQIDYERLRELSNQTQINHNKIKYTINKIGNNCQNLRTELAQELETITLPETEGVLILITSIKSSSALKEIGVWRGLSNRVELTEFEEYNLVKTPANQAQKKRILLGLAIALILVIAIAFFWVIKTQHPSQPEITPTPSTISQNSYSIFNKK